MPQKKFQQLFRFFHLNDNSKQVPYGQTGHDKLFKVRKLLDLLSPLFESEFEMHQSCTIDEAMIPFKGRLRFKQYMKDKPTKWGIKVFILADAPTGYVKRLQVYTGKGLDSCVTDVGLCTKVVLDLMKGFDHWEFSCTRIIFTPVPFSISGFTSAMASMLVVLYVPIGLVFHLNWLSRLLELTVVHTSTLVMVLSLHVHGWISAPCIFSPPTLVSV